MIWNIFNFLGVPKCFINCNRNLSFVKLGSRIIFPCVISICSILTLAEEKVNPPYKPSIIVRL